MASVEPEITLGLCNGQTLSFIMPNEDALGSKFGPDSQQLLFDPLIFMMGNGIIMTGVRSTAIAWLRIHSDFPLSWKFPFEAEEIEWIPEVEFRNANEIKRVHTKIAITSNPEGTPIEVYTRLQSGDGLFHHFRIKTHSLPKCYRLSIPDRISQMQVYHAKHPEGGWLILNLKTFLKLEAYPGAVDLPESVWPAQRFTESK